MPSSQTPTFNIFDPCVVGKSALVDTKTQISPFMRFTFLHPLLFLFFALMVNMDAAAQNPATELQTQLTSNGVHFPIGESITLTFSVTNNGGKAARFCRYMTPLEGFKGNFLDATDAIGNKIPYAGAMVKRGKPRPSAFVHVAPQGSIVAEFNLLDAYPIRQAGTYRIQFKGNPSMNGLADSNVLEITVAE